MEGFALPKSIMLLSTGKTRDPTRPRGCWGKADEGGPGQERQWEWDCRRFQDFRPGFRARSGLTDVAEDWSDEPRIDEVGNEHGASGRFKWGLGPVIGPVNHGIFRHVCRKSTADRASHP
jgi:hypothetical protein